MITEGVHRRGLPLSKLVEMNSLGPAKRFGLHPRKGELRPGADADMVLVDLETEREVVHEGKGTCIYEGMKLKGWPVLTVARGRVVFEDGAVDPEAVGAGRCVTRPSEVPA
jgi:dihydroorotase-like cyclic amidohydrolase